MRSALSFHSLDNSAISTTAAHSDVAAPTSISGSSVIQLLRERKREHIDIALFARSDFPAHHPASISMLMEQARKRRLLRQRTTNLIIGELSAREELVRLALKGSWFLWVRFLTCLLSSSYLELKSKAVERESRASFAPKAKSKIGLSLLMGKIDLLSSRVDREHLGARMRLWSRFSEERRNSSNSVTKMNRVELRESPIPFSRSRSPEDPPVGLEMPLQESSALYLSHEGSVSLGTSCIVIVVDVLQCNMLDSHTDFLLQVVVEEEHAVRLVIGETQALEQSLIYAPGNCCEALTVELDGGKELAALEEASQVACDSAAAGVAPRATKSSRPPASAALLISSNVCDLEVDEALIRQQLGRAQAADRSRIALQCLLQTSHSRRDADEKHSSKIDLHVPFSAPAGACEPTQEARPFSSSPSDVGTEAASPLSVCIPVEAHAAACFALQAAGRGAIARRHVHQRWMFWRVDASARTALLGIAWKSLSELLQRELADRESLARKRIVSTAIFAHNTVLGEAYARLVLARRQRQVFLDMVSVFFSSAVLLCFFSDEAFEREDISAAEGSQIAYFLQQSEVVCRLDIVTQQALHFQKFLFSEHESLARHAIDEECWVTLDTLTYVDETEDAAAVSDASTLSEQDAPTTRDSGETVSSDVSTSCSDEVSGDEIGDSCSDDATGGKEDRVAEGPRVALTMQKAFGNPSEPQPEVSDGAQNTDPVDAAENQFVKRSRIDIHEEAWSRIFQSFFDVQAGDREKIAENCECALRMAYQLHQVLAAEMTCRRRLLQESVNEWNDMLGEESSDEEESEFSSEGEEALVEEQEAMSPLSNASHATRAPMKAVNHQPTDARGRNATALDEDEEVSISTDLSSTDSDFSIDDIETPLFSPPQQHLEQAVAQQLLDEEICERRGIDTENILILLKLTKAQEYLCRHAALRTASIFYSEAAARFHHLAEGHKDELVRRQTLLMPDRKGSLRGSLAPESRHRPPPSHQTNYMAQLQRAKNIRWI
jgi:hypothetical protein